jgi:hypothetical protein
MIRALVLAAVASSACAGAAPRVWSTAHRTLPSGIDRAIYADLSALRGTRGEQWIYERAAAIMNLSIDAGTAVRQQCGIDPSSAEMVLASEGYGRAVMFVRVPGKGEREITRCAERLLHANARRDGEVVVLHAEIGVVGEMLWVTPQVFAFVIGMPDRPTLMRLAGGKGGLEDDAPFAEGLVGVDYHSPVWGVFVPPAGSEARGAVSFHVTLAGRQVGVEVRVPAGNVLRAWGMARSIRRMLSRWQDDISSFSAAAEGDDVIIQVVLDEKQIDRALERALD